MIAEMAPPERRQLILAATRNAFLDGLPSGMRVAAVATALGAVLARVFLPARGADLNASTPESETATA